MKLHQVYKIVKCKLILDPGTSRRRFVPIEGQGLPINIFIQGDMAIRKLHPLNTVFIATDVKVCKKSDRDTFYLRAKNLSLSPLSSLKLDIHKP
jgi:hypothetical protein